MIEREKRIKIIRPVYVEGINEGSYSALAVNFSKKGLCVITNLDVEVNQELELFSGHLWHEPQTARVLWKSHMVSDSNKIGMSLTPANK